MAERQPVEIMLFAGTFESQPLAFAHLYDIGPSLDLGEIEVICKEDPARRLSHYFAKEQVELIVDTLGLHTSVILAFPEAGPVPASSLLFPLGRFTGTRIRA
ncbi:MAG: hypothetical protein AAF618_08465 [Pseudomonadota bacterium]